MKNIAIFGANGNLGHHAVAAFTKEGWQVRAITRDGKYKHTQTIKTYAADAMNRDQVIAASDGCDFIFNGLNPPYPQWSKMCMPFSNNIIAAARAHNAVHLFPGNVYNYGTDLPEKLLENTAMNADSKKGKIRCEMEAVFQQAAEQRNTQTVILRAGDFLGGPSDANTWFNLAIAKNLTKGKMTYPGPLDKVHSWAYLPDLANTFVKLAERAPELGNFASFNFTGHALNGQQMKEVLEKITGRSLKHQGMPWPLLRFAGLFSPMLREVCEMSYLWKMPHAMDESKLEGVIGVVPKTQLEEALVQALRELDMGDLVGGGLATTTQIVA